MKEKLNNDGIGQLCEVLKETINQYYKLINQE